MWIKTQTQNINNTNDPQKKYRLETVFKVVFMGWYVIVVSPGDFFQHYIWSEND